MSGKKLPAEMAKILLVLVLSIGIPLFARRYDMVTHNSEVACMTVWLRATGHELVSRRWTKTNDGHVVRAVVRGVCGREREVFFHFVVGDRWVRVGDYLDQGERQ